MDYVAKQAVYVPVTDYLNLELHLLDTQPGVTPDSLLTGLLKRWLAAELERSAPKSNPAIHGFQWKNLFLPEGTRLRTAYGDKIEFAKVAGDCIVSDEGASLTPSVFANRHAQGRNAWRFIWLRFAGEEQWIRAYDCRARLGDAAPKRSKRKLSPSNEV